MPAVEEVLAYSGGDVQCLACDGTGQLLLEPCPLCGDVAVLSQATSGAAGTPPALDVYGAEHDLGKELMALREELGAKARECEQLRADAERATAEARLLRAQLAQESVAAAAASRDPRGAEAHQSAAAAASPDPCRAHAHQSEDASLTPASAAAAPAETLSLHTGSSPIGKLVSEEAIEVPASGAWTHSTAAALPEKTDLAAVRMPSWCDRMNTVLERYTPDSSEQISSANPSSAPHFSGCHPGMHAEVSSDGDFWDCLGIGDMVAVGTDKRPGFIQSIRHGASSLYIVVLADGSKVSLADPACITPLAPFVERNVSVSIQLIGVFEAQALAACLELISEQDLPRLEFEVLIIDDSTAHTLRSGVLDGIDQGFVQTCVRYVSLDQYISMGAKRNLGVALSRGSVIMHWSCCDYFGPTRARVQSATILSGEADVTVLTPACSYHVNEVDEQVGYTKEDQHKRRWLCTLSYRRTFWNDRRSAQQYAEAPLLEDAFLYRNLLGLQAAVLQELPVGCVAFLPASRFGEAFVTAPECSQTCQQPSFLNSSGCLPKLWAGKPHGWMMHTAVSRLKQEVAFLDIYLQGKPGNVKVPLAYFQDLTVQFQQVPEVAERRTLIKALVKRLRKEGMSRFDRTSFVTAVWCCCQIQVSPDNALWAEVCKLAESSVADLHVGDLSLLTYALGCVGLQDCNEFIDSLLDAVEKKVDLFQPQDVMLLTTAMAHFGVHRESLLLDLLRCFPREVYVESQWLRLSLSVVHLKPSWSEVSIEPTTMNMCTETAWSHDFNGSKFTVVADNTFTQGRLALTDDEIWQVLHNRECEFMRVQNPVADNDMQACPNDRELACNSGRELDEPPTSFWSDAEPKTRSIDVSGKQRKKKTKRNRPDIEDIDAVLDEFRRACHEDQEQEQGIQPKSSQVLGPQVDGSHHVAEETILDAKALANRKKKEKRRQRRDMLSPQCEADIAGDFAEATEDELPGSSQTSEAHQAAEDRRPCAAARAARVWVELQKRLAEERQICEAAKRKRLEEERCELEAEERRQEESRQKSLKEREERRQQLEKLKAEAWAARAMRAAQRREREGDSHGQGNGLVRDDSERSLKLNRRPLATKLKKRQTSEACSREAPPEQDRTSAGARGSSPTQASILSKVQAACGESRGGSAEPCKMPGVFDATEAEGQVQRQRKQPDTQKQKAAEEKVAKKAGEEAAKRALKLAAKEKVRVETARRRSKEEEIKKSSDVAASILCRASRADDSEIESHAAVDHDIEMWKLRRLIKSLRLARSSGYNSMLSMIIGCRDSIHHANKVLTESLSACDTLQLHAHKLQAQTILVSAMQRLKMYRQTPVNGLAIFCGFILTADGKERKVTIDFEPPKPINTNMYRNGKQFFTDDLEELLESEGKFGFIIMDGNGTLFGTLQGNRREVLSKFSVDLPRKHGRGGQSALRFARLRLEKRCNYVRKVAELAKHLFISGDKAHISGLVLAGCADFKLDLAKSDHFDPRLNALIIKPLLDLSYGGESGFYRAIELATDSLRDVKLIQEKQLISRLLEEVARDTGKYCIGAEDTIQGLSMGAVHTLILWESLELKRLHLRNPQTGEELLKYALPEQEADESFMQCPRTGVELDLLDSVPFIEWAVANYGSMGARVEFVTDRSLEGHQFCKGFGGIGGLLRYCVDFESFDQVHGQNDEHSEDSQTDPSTDSDEDFW